MCRFKYSVLFFSFFAIFYSLFPNRSFAQATPPVPYPSPYVSCNQTSPNEWHSLRPYQSSPCNIPIKLDEQALLCGNDLIVNDIIYIPEDEPWEIVPGTCTPDCPGNCGPIKCKVRATRNFTIAFDAFGSELPIAGNTELVAGDKPFDVAGLLQRWKLVGDPGWLPEWLKSPINFGKTPGFDEKPPPDVTKYPRSSDYYEAYMEWRGKSCISTADIPIVGKILPNLMLCGEFLTGGWLNPNYWASLYNKIPLSSTEDRIGKAHVTSMVWVPEKSSPDLIIDPYPNPNTIWHPKDPVYGQDPGVISIPKPYPEGYGEVPLYFPHMEETVELSSLLQSTYLPKELATVSAGPGPNLQPSPAPNADCKIVNVRYNPGDQLFGERAGGNTGLGQPNANVTYDAIFWCEGKCVDTNGDGVCDTPILNCVKNAWFYSDVTIYAPLIDELYQKTVTSETSILRRMSPRSGENTPLEKIEDIPAVTDVKHFARDNITPKPPIQLVSDPAELYIPHFGSIYDYLLHNMQTALRPKGFPGKPTGLTKKNQIPEIDQANEYLSWYLNGTLYRAEQNPLDETANCIGELTKRPGFCSLAVGAVCSRSLIPPVLGFADGKANCGLLNKCCVNPNLLAEPVKGFMDLDINRVINLTGPLNKLLSQQSQWRNTTETAKESFVQNSVSKVAQPSPRAKVNRHNQIAGCTWGFSLPFSVDLTWPIQIHIGNIGGFPTACDTKSQEYLPPEAAPPGGGPVLPGTCDICEIASRYNVPCCFLKGIWDVETGQSKNIPTGTYGNLQCCNGVGACGPMQIMGGLLGPLSAGKKFNLCEKCDSWELAARLLILKKCVAAGKCNTWDWIEGLQDMYPISESELWVPCAYYGQDVNCFPDNFTQCRWGDGKTYGDAVNSWCKSNSSLPEACTQQYCSALTPPVTCP